VFVKDQLRLLKNIHDIPSFDAVLKKNHQYPLSASSIEILQLNITKRCNLHCKHCHVEAGPNRNEIMSKETMRKCIKIIESSSIHTIDITGGAPEMNLDLEWLITELSQFNKRLIVRSNLVILENHQYRKFLDIYTLFKVEIVTSLPDIHEDKANRQRGSDFFKHFVSIIKELNKLGYGKHPELQIHIVHNPVGAYLPDRQETIEADYHQQLQLKYGIIFNSLFALTNCPVGRYLDYLINTDNFDDYMQDLHGAYNPQTIDSVMCRKQISVGWDGTLYDCDFNQMLDLSVNHGAPNHIDSFDLKSLINREIVTGNHCFCCTAGSGSSSQGTTV